MTHPIETVPMPGAGVLDGRVHRLALRVYYEDTDFAGIVYHANYLRYFERARTELVRALGIDQLAWHAETGCSFAVKTMTIDYVRPARMDDIVVVETSVGKVGGASMQLAQRLLRGADVLTTADVLVVCLKDGRLHRLPASLRGASTG